MKRTLYIAFLALGSFLVAACGGGGGSSSSAGTTLTQSGGFAPAELTEDMVITSTDANATGVIRLTNTPARVAYFSNPKAPVHEDYFYTGNYTYTKTGPNMAEVKIVNVRSNPITSAADDHWTIIGHLSFVDEETVVFTGTETLVNSEEADHNDPMGFGGALNDWYWDDKNNDGQITPGEVFGDVGGGSRNFSLNCTFTKG